MTDKELRRQNNQLFFALCRLIGYCEGKWRIGCSGKHPVKSAKSLAMRILKKRAMAANTMVLREAK